MHTVEHFTFSASRPGSCVCSLETSLLGQIALPGVLPWAREFILSSDSVFAPEILTSSIFPPLSDQVESLVVGAAFLKDSL